MTRPYIFCHMMISLDGKIMGNFMNTRASEEAGDLFYEKAFGPHRYYRHQGWLSGRITTDDNFTFYRKPDIRKNFPPVPDGDFITEKTGMYYVSIDPKGRLGWQENYIRYGDVKAQVIEVLTKEASDGYRDMLRRKGISYIVAGRKELDYEMVLQKLKDLFSVDMLMLGGGGVLNWSFIQRGLCDELSLVVSASADGSPDTPSLFHAVPGLSDDSPVSFRLELAETRGSALWLRYRVEGAKGVQARS
ncbi:dihydrofolate reductase family protein [Dialister sp.]|uniref:dihydrofolate reductase family protein n=1 Tax=Dialister sp. TaxID=1955814 RepID=UPI003EFC9780